MKIQTFNNKKGLIYGTDTRRISCNREGVLKIGTTEVSVSPNAEAIMPVLVNGCTGVYSATFTDKFGDVYELEKVTIKGGRIESPPQTAIEFMELRCRLEEVEAECESMREHLRELSNIFDTNSLNFLIK